MKVRSLKLKDRRFGNQWFDQIEHRWNYSDILNDPQWRKDWISVDGVLYGGENDNPYRSSYLWEIQGAAS